MRLWLFLAPLLFSSLTLAQSFTFTVNNDALTTNDSFINLGELSLHGCSSVTLTNLSSLGEGGSPATCIESRSPSNIKVTLLIPIKIHVTTSTPLLVQVEDVATTKAFSSNYLYKSRNSQIGGGVSFYDVDEVMENNETLLLELELGAQIIGSNAKSQYESYIVFIVGPNL